MCKWQHFQYWMESLFKEISLVIIFLPMGYSTFSWSLVSNGQNFHSHINQQTHSNHSRLWLAATGCSMWEMITFSLHSTVFSYCAAISPHKINTRSHYKDFRSDHNKCYYLSSVILFLYCSSKNREVNSLKVLLRNCSVRCFAYFLLGQQKQPSYKVANRWTGT